MQEVPRGHARPQLRVRVQLVDPNADADGDRVHPHTAAIIAAEDDDELDLLSRQAAIPLQYMAGGGRAHDTLLCTCVCVSVVCVCVRAQGIARNHDRRRGPERVDHRHIVEHARQHQVHSEPHEQHHVLGRIFQESSQLDAADEGAHSVCVQWRMRTLTHVCPFVRRDMQTQPLYLLLLATWIATCVVPGRFLVLAGACALLRKPPVP